MNNIIVGDTNCKFDNIARLILKSPASGQVCKRLDEVLRALDLDEPTILTIRRKYDSGLATYFESLVSGLSAWRAEQGNASTLSNLVSAFKKCGLQGVTDAIESEFVPVDAPTTHYKKFLRAPEAVSSALNLTDELMVINTTSSKLLCEWVEETAEENVILISDIGDLFKHDNIDNREKIIMVKQKGDALVSKTLQELRQMKKRIVILIEQKNWVNDIGIHVIQHKTNWNDLTEHYQHELFNKVFSVGKRETTLSQISTDLTLINVNKMLNDRFLTNLILGSAQLFPIRYPCMLNYYIERKLIPRFQIDNDIFQDISDDIFVFTGLNRLELSNKTNVICDISTNQVQKQVLDAKFIELILYSDFQAICVKTKSSVHWLHSGNDQLTWVKSKGQMSVVQKNVLVNNLRYTDDQFIDFLDNGTKQFLSVNSQSVILSDSPGMGKSVLLAKLAHTLSVKYPDRIILFVRLEEFIKQKKSFVNSDDIFETLINMSCEGQKLSKMVLQNMSKQHDSNKSAFFVEVLIDGFDEVNENDRKSAETLFKKIQTDLSGARIWLTTRPHLLYELENSLNVLGYNIEPFQDAEQIGCLQSFWKMSASDHNKTLDAQRLRSFSKKCLSTIKDKLGKHERDIAGIPLQCSLIAEIYSRNAIDYCNLSNVQNKQVPPVFNYYRISDLYTKFVENKVGKYCRLFISDDTTWEKTKIRLIELHTKISLNLFFPGNRKSSASNLIDVQELCNLGIIELCETNLVPRFVHRTFAEYFIALYIVKILYSKAEDFQIDLLANVFATTGDSKNVFGRYSHNEVQVHKVSFEQNVICFFIDNILAENKRNENKISNCNLDGLPVYPILTAAISKDYKLIFQLITRNLNWTTFITGNSRYDTVDNSEKIATILFLAVRYSSVELIRLILKHFKDGDESNPSLTMPVNNGITLLHVAVQYRDFTVVRELINNWYHNIEELQGLVYYCISGTVKLEETLIIEKVEVLSLLHSKNSNIINSEFKGFAPLHFTNVHSRLQSKLLALDADINIKRYDGATVLHKRMHSALHLHTFLVEILNNEKRKLICQTLVKIRDDSGCTALHKQVSYYNLRPETLRIFYELGADYNSVNDEGESVIELAIIHRQTEEVFRSLIDYGSNIHRKDKTGASLLHLARLEENNAAESVLVEKGLKLRKRKFHQSC